MSVELLMSETAELSVDASRETGAPFLPSAGAALKRARENAGLHVAALAVSLKVPVKKLEALEADRWDLLPDMVFARALAASICRTLKLDPAPVLDRLPTVTRRLVTDEAGINAPFRGAAGEGGGVSPLRYLSRPLVLAVLALLLGVLVLMLLPSVRPPSMKPLTAVVDLTKSAQNGVGNAPAMPASVDAVSVAAPSDVMAAPASAPSLQVPPAARVTSEVPPSSSGDVLVFKTTAPSWIEVSDVHGALVLRKLMIAGESAGISGALPLAVVVGRADVTTVEVRGKALDLTAVSRDNVARFEVK